MADQQQQLAFALRELYDGALTVSLPTDLLSADEIRQIPDNQEVFLSPTSSSSVIFDILSRAEPPDHPCTTDAEALRYHYDDITGEGHVRSTQEPEEGEETKMWETAQAIVTNLGESVPAYTLFATQHPRSTVDGLPGLRTGGQITDFTAILLILVRLEKQKTDLLVTINVPHTRGEYVQSEVDLEKGQLGRDLQAARSIQQQILKTLRIVDWSLFVEDD